MRWLAAFLFTLVTAAPALAADFPSGGMGGTCGTVTALARFTASRTLACGLLKDDGTNVTAPSSAIKILGGTSGGVQLGVPAVAGSNTVTFPAATDTLLGKATTDTLTNKTFDTAGSGNVFKINTVAITDKTGTGKAVLDTSPTIVTPTITSLANANHTHQDSAGGGQLVATSVFASGTVPTARLGSGTASADVNLRGDQTWASPLWNYQGTSRISVSSTSQLAIGVGVIPLKLASGTWIMRPITAAITTGCTNSGLTAATLYRVYAYDNAGTTTCEIVTTARATDTTYGVEIKSGDATRTLVGMVYMGAGSPGTFIDSATQRFTVSWFNRRAISAANKFSTDRTTTSGSFAEINSEIRIEFVTWSTEAVRASYSGAGTTDNNGGLGYIGLSFDGASADNNVQLFTAATANQLQPVAPNSTKTLSEGYHYATIIGAASSNTVTYRSTSTGMWLDLRG